jgi:SAM-dependent methyltransferase
MRFWSERLPYLTEFARTHRVLHMGPGRDESFGIKVDFNRAVNPDVLADLNRPPFPFRDDSFDAVYAFSIIEHLDNFFQVFADIHRVLKPGGFVVVLTPHFSNDASYIDPSHRLHLSARSFDYLIEGSDIFANYGFYSGARFRVRERLLMVESPWSYVPGLQRLANRASTFYERHLCFLIRARGLYFELEAVK